MLAWGETTYAADGTVHYYCAAGRSQKAAVTSALRPDHVKCKAFSEFCPTPAVARVVSGPARPRTQAPRLFFSQGVGRRCPALSRLDTIKMVAAYYDSARMQVGMPWAQLGSWLACRGTTWTCAGFRAVAPLHHAYASSIGAYTQQVSRRQKFGELRTAVLAGRACPNDVQWTDTVECMLT